MIALSLRRSGVRVAFTDRSDTLDQACSVLGGDQSLVRVRQVHGTRVISVPDEGEGVEADGIYLPAGRPEVAGIATADCLPLVLANHNGDAVALHVGWRGLVGGVIEAGLSRLGGNGLEAVIGPHIRSCCYQFLGPERYIVEQRFGPASFAGDNLSLEYGVQQVLEQNRVGSMIAVEQCTFCDDGYHSYRRDRTSMRQLTLVGAGGR
jgi:copper oxidase (laccase) domain-containing protein